MGKFGRFIGEEAEVSLWISHTKGVKGDLTMRPFYNIHDLGVERNKEQKKALRYAWLTWAVYGALFLFFGFVGSAIGGKQGVMAVIAIALALTFPTIVICADYYTASVYPTEAQKKEFLEKRGISK